MSTIITIISYLSVALALIDLYLLTMQPNISNLYFSNLYFLFSCFHALPLLENPTGNPGMTVVVQAYFGYGVLCIHGATCLVADHLV